MVTVGEGSAAGTSPRIPSDVFVEVIRVLMVVLATAAGEAWFDATGAALGACAGYVAGGILGRSLRRAAGAFERQVERTSAVTLGAGAVGALTAGGMGVVIGLAGVVLLPGRWGLAVLGITAWTGCYAGFQVGARKGEELFDLWLRGSAPVLPETTGEPLVLVDSSAAMDGRLLPLARSGFLPGRLAVPRFVLDELQGLSDAADATRRRRARRGLELLEAVRTEGPGLLVLPDEVPERAEVDAKLLALAARLGATVVTCDRGLVAVGGVEGVRCIDVTRLAETMQEPLVPGEVVRLHLTRRGKDEGQAVGFLDDGTMVVVAGGDTHLGEDAEVEVTTSVPTSKGRLYFATLAG
jgi:uncharacterized protein YacL